MAQSITQVDAFTAKPFGGNPAAVCILPASAEPDWMQSVAREMNLSETAFLVKQEDGYNLRWFTPAIEVDLCGHATLASAHVLWEEGHLAADETARFHTRSGLLLATRDGDWINLDFPAAPPQETDAPAGLLESLGLASAVWVGLGRAPRDYLIEVADEATLRALAPNFTDLARVPARGVIVTSRSATPDYDFVSRFFGPAAGVNEDPVTGSAHSALTPYWAAKLGKMELRAYQASARGGDLRVRLAGERVIIGGQAVTTLRGDLLA